MSERESLPKHCNPAEVQDAASKLWLDSGAFAARPDPRPPEKRYVIMMPLPNVTGALHMGHAMDNVMQDLLVRWHRMQGDNALWMPGTDHAGIATQAVVEKRLKELEGKTRHDIGRKGLVDRIWAWKDQYEARIVGQQQRMGCSCDWERHRFTMDAVCARAVRHAFFRMFDDGLIYRGKRLVNWDVFLQTSVSDDEVYHETVQGHFWHLRYPVIDPQPGEPDSVVVATTRPETMLGDTAVAVHPDPAEALRGRLAKLRESLSSAPEKERAALEGQIASLTQRQKDLLPQLNKLRDMARAGRKVRLPLLDRELPLILDEWAKPELGSGCVKITPAHDPNDYDVWTRHKKQIERINVLNPDGTLNAAAGPYQGLDRMAVRLKVVADLEAQGLLAEVEDREVEIGHSDRSKTPIEPYLSDQWFVRMGDVPGGIVMGRGTDKEQRASGLVQAAMDAVSDGRVRVHPDRYAKTYMDWLAEKRDWPISRQLWWGHQIPVWSKVATWNQLNLDELQPLRAALGKTASARLHWLDAGTSARVDGSLQRPATDADAAAAEPCAVDVCLLEDDAELIAKLEALGFTRDPDVLDTWFSSALWPFSTLGWPDPATAPIREGQPTLAATGDTPSCLDYYYPGSCLVTARDIITLWVARMVLAGLYTLGDIPFTDVFIHANILDGKGERMSKSKGNGIDPVDIIEQYGADAMRYVLCDMQTGSQDIRLPVTAVCPSCEHRTELAQAKHGRSVFTYLCGKCRTEFDVLGTMPDLPASKLLSDRFEVGRSFCTKLWNSARFAFMNLEGGAIAEASVVEGDLSEKLPVEDRWVLAMLNQAVRTVHGSLEAYNPSQAINAAREFFWSVLCDWYLELIKPRLAEGDSQTAQVARRVLAHCLDKVLRLLHPFVPFLTEYLWQRLNEQVPDRALGSIAPARPSPNLVTASWPRAPVELDNHALLEVFTDLQELTRAVREARASAGVPPREEVVVTVRASAARSATLRGHGHVVERLGGCKELRFDANATRQPGAAVKVVGDLQVFVHDIIDDAAERERLTKQRAKASNDLAQCEKKLANPSFVDRAPAAVVDEHRKRLTTLKASLEAIDESLERLR